VLVLEGEQGSKKSTSLHVLGGDWHVETTMGTETKDFFMQFSGKAIIEFSEGETLSRTEVKKMKAIITTQVDKYRPPYERVSKDFPRRCVFAMTTNQEQYLKDETGNRRWLPVKVEKKEADVEWIKENRDQLFAEAYHRVVVGKEKIYEFPEEETRAQQQSRMILDPNTDRVAEWYFEQGEVVHYVDGISVHDVYAGVFNSGFSGGKAMNKFEEMMISNILKGSLGLEKRRVVRNGIRVYRWFNPNKDTVMTQITEKSGNKISIPFEKY
jgi:predicted P-loop ATPase